MTIKILCYCFLFLGYTCGNYSFGQSASSDSMLLSAAINNVTQRYTNALGDEAHVFNGKEYVNYDKYFMKGHQFYKSNEEQPGAIYYDGYLFAGVPLLYDVVLDQIIISEPTGSLLFKLENNKIATFNVHGHSFIRLVTDSLASSAISTGFYDLLTDSKTRILAKRRKTMFEEATPKGMQGEFTEADKFFIRKNNTYYPVSKKKTLLAVFPNKKKELQKYIRSQHLKFKKESREAAIVKLVQYYDTLPQPENPSN